MFDDLPVLIKPKGVNRNELIAMVGEVKWRFMRDTSLMFGRTCDVALTTLSFFKNIDTHEHYCDHHNFWGVSFAGEVRGLFTISPRGYGVITLDKRPVGDIETLFDFGLSLIKAIELLQEYTTNESEFTSAVSMLECDGFESHAYSLITRDGEESIRKRDLQLFSWSFPHVFATVNEPSKARKALFSYGGIVSERLNPACEISGVIGNGRNITLGTPEDAALCDGV